MRGSFALLVGGLALAHAIPGDVHTLERRAELAAFESIDWHSVKDEVAVRLAARGFADLSKRWDVTQESRAPRSPRAPRILSTPSISLNSTESTGNSTLVKRDVDCDEETGKGCLGTVYPPSNIEPGGPDELSRCVAVHANKGIPGGVQVWNIVIEEEHLYDDVCGSNFLEQWRKKCNWFPVFIKDWRCDRIDLLFFNTSISIPTGTSWMYFITKHDCKPEWGRRRIEKATGGVLNNIDCRALELDDLPSMEYKDLRGDNSK